MRQHHRAGEKAFVDYSGMTLDIVDPRTGAVRPAQVFVCVLGASSYAFAEATWTQSLEDWIRSHVHAFEFFGGVTEITVPDNLKSGVTQPCRYEPLLNRTYEDMAQHYGTVVIPARVRKPRDKAKAEQGVQMVERWILAVLRHETIHSLAEANRRIRKLLDQLNHREMRGLGKSRRQLFEELDRPHLRPLPTARFEISYWGERRCNIDYHVEVDGHYYSAPYQLARQMLTVRTTATTVELFQNTRRVSSHVRSYDKGRHTTLPEHMPESHRKHLEWTPSRLIRWGQKAGPSTGKVIEEVLESRPHPEQGYRSCLGFIRLGERHGPDRLEAACRRALLFKTTSYRSIKSILEARLDQQPLPDPDHQKPDLPPHDNVRGPDYYE
jgi:transposase